MKKTITLILALAMVLGVAGGTLAASARNFTDVPEDAWYAEYLDYAVSLGIISGTTDTTFSPGDTMTRAMFVTVLARMNGVDPANVTSASNFSDIELSDWYDYAVVWANENEIVAGTSDNIFSPHLPINREQIAVILHRFVLSTGAQLPTDNAAAASFKDASSVSDYARDSVEAMRKSGFVSGDDMGNYNPLKNITRAEATAILVRLSQHLDLPKADEPVTAEDDAIITKVALVTDVGTIDDESFNQACWLGVEEWGLSTGVEFVYYQPIEDSGAAREMAIAQAVAEGANAIVLPGFLFGTTILDLQDMYPDVYLLAIDVGSGDLTYDYVTYYEPSANVTCITFKEEQAGYLAGYAAVQDGYTKLGFLGGMAVPAVVRYGYGFVQGANDAAAELSIEIEINYTYGGQFYGDESITAQMEGWYSSGTEIVFACGGGIYTSAVEAAMQYDAMVIGVDVDQHDIGTKAEYSYNPFLTSAMKGLQAVTVTVLDELQNGNWAAYSGQFITLGLAEGNYVGLPTAAGSWEFETFTIEAYEELLDAIASGAVAIDDSVENADVSVYEYTNTTVNYIA